MGSVVFILSIFGGIGFIVLGLSRSVTADQLEECFDDNGQLNPDFVGNSNCLLPLPGCEAKSFPPVPKGLDTVLSDYIVSQHNIRRSLVAAGGETRGLTGRQPGSTCMAKLEWDDELMNSAQNWANQCTLSGAPKRNKITTQPVEGEYVGQNAYAFVDSANTFFDDRSYTQKTYFDKAIESWYGEVVNFSGANVASFVAATGSNPVTGHYTQMIWGKTTKIGCGWRRWALNDGTPRFVWLVVCHYWPGGNVKGQPVYNTTLTITPCGNCAPQSTSNIFSGSENDGKLCKTHF